MRFACQILPFYNNIRWLSWRILNDMKIGKKTLLNILNTVFIVSTVCPWSSDQFYIVSNYIKWFTTSWTYSMSRKYCLFLYCEYTMKFRQDFLGSLYLKGLVQFSLCTWYNIQINKTSWTDRNYYIYSTYDESEINKNTTLQNYRLINMYCMSKKSFPLLYSKYTVCQRPSKFLNKMDQSLLDMQ